MSEQDTNNDSVVETPPADDAEKEEKEKDFIAKKEWDTLAFKYRQQGKELEKRASEINELKERLDKIQAEPSKDSANELKQSFQAELAKISEQRDTWREKFNKVALEGKVKEAAANKVIDVDDFWLFASSKVALTEDESGNYVPEVKNSVASLDKFIDEYCAAKPHNARTKKVSGAGVPNAGNKEKAIAGELTLSDLKGLSAYDRKKALIDNPKLYEEAKKLF